MNSDRRNFITAACASAFAAVSGLIPRKRAEAAVSTEGLPSVPPPNRERDKRGSKPLWSDMQEMCQFFRRAISFMVLYHGVYIVVVLDESEGTVNYLNVFVNPSSVIDGEPEIVTFDFDHEMRHWQAPYAVDVIRREIWDAVNRLEKQVVGDYESEGA